MARLECHWSKARRRNRWPDLPRELFVLQTCSAILANQLGERGFQIFQNRSGADPPFEKEFYPTPWRHRVVLIAAGLRATYSGLALKWWNVYPLWQGELPCDEGLVETNYCRTVSTASRTHPHTEEDTLLCTARTDRWGLLGNEKAINSHPVYGKLRKYHLRQDFLFSEVWNWQNLYGRLFIHNRSTIWQWIFVVLPCYYRKTSTNSYGIS